MNGETELKLGTFFFFFSPFLFFGVTKKRVKEMELTRKEKGGNTPGLLSCIKTVIS